MRLLRRAVPPAGRAQGRTDTSTVGCDTSTDRVASSVCQATRSTGPRDLVDGPTRHVREPTDTADGPSGSVDGPDRQLHDSGGIVDGPADHVHGPTDDADESRRQRSRFVLHRGRADHTRTRTGS